MAVRIRLKRMGRRHRPFFRICAMDARAPRDGKVIEELGYYDPMVRETDARAILNGERIEYWLGVGAQPTPKVEILIKKYGKNGTRLEAQRQALERLAASRHAPPPQPVAASAAKQTRAEEPSQGEQESAQTEPEAAEAQVES